MPEDLVSIALTAGFFAITAAWIPLLDFAIVRYRRARNFAAVRAELRNGVPQWLQADAEDAA